MVKISGRALSTASGAPPALTGAAFDWPARAQEDARRAHREWQEHGITLLPLGTRFNSVCLTAPLVHAAAGTGDLETVTATLARVLDGPVIHDRPQDKYHALVERYPTAHWGHPEAPMLGPGHYLSVPASDLRGPTGLYWAVPPRLPGDLCPVRAVTSLLRVARDGLRGRHS
ncbi:hypothetical protein [Streptomyces silaceus]|uniref:hypothetical protein n=1 Tax=Streptomyces silaceus TaxID=545123 RepID=UPI0006EB790B|nr:hypothetical protein [Streptomyces silaceus]